MQKLQVFLNNRKIGFGYIYYYSNGSVSEPELYNDEGIRLSEGWYELVVTDENSLVVVPRQNHNY